MADRSDDTDVLGKTGAGGEYHQVADGDTPSLTTQQGVVISDDQNSLRAGPRGPALLEDFSSARRSTASTTSASPSASFTRAASARTAISS